MSYDGRFLASSSWSGAINGQLALAYDNDFRIASETVIAGAASTVVLGYDADSLVVCASDTDCSPPASDALLINHDPAIARYTDITLGPTTEAFSYNTYGELAAITSHHASTLLFEETVDQPSAPRDALGRIVTRAETTPSGSTHMEYVYDLRGRLEEVFRDGASVEKYAYDANSNRLSLETPSETVVGTYDAQDRLLSYGAYTFAYGPNGELVSKADADSGETTAYAYDVRGNLVRVDLPGGDVIEYLIDGRDRRVGKTRNGVLEKQWLWRGQLNVVAELDGAGNLIARFVYASRPNIPDYVERGGARYRIFADHLGSPRIAVNVADPTDIPLMLEWSAFGQASGTGVGWMPMGFAGGLHDADSGLTRFGARDYDPLIGRWISKDPIRFTSGDAPNLYLYTNGDPLNFVDRTGRQTAVLPWWAPQAAAVAGGALAGARFGPLGALAGAAAAACIFATADEPIGRWSCIEQGQVTRGRTQCQYSCTNSATGELRVVYRDLLGPTVSAPRRPPCPEADFVAKTL